jgi:hypothetical protein
LGSGLEQPPRLGHGHAVREHNHSIKESGERVESLWSPGPDTGPLGQLTDGHEGDRKRLPRQTGPERAGEPIAQQRGGHVRVQDDDAHSPPARREAYRSAKNES